MWNRCSSSYIPLHNGIPCQDLAKQLSHYLYFFSFLFLLDSLHKFYTVSLSVMNIEWDYSYYQPWSDNEWLVDKMIAMQEEMLMVQNEDITMQ